MGALLRAHRMAPLTLENRDRCKILSVSAATQAHAGQYGFAVAACL